MKESSRLTGIIDYNVFPNRPTTLETGNVGLVKPRKSCQHTRETAGQDSELSVFVETQITV